jgi:hypothetical protein
VRSLPFPPGDLSSSEFFPPQRPYTLSFPTRVIYGRQNNQNLNEKARRASRSFPRVAAAAATQEIGFRPLVMSACWTVDGGGRRPAKAAGSVSKVMPGIPLRTSISPRRNAIESTRRPYQFAPPSSSSPSPSVRRSSTLFPMRTARKSQGNRPKEIVLLTQFSLYILFNTFFSKKVFHYKSTVF